MEWSEGGSEALGTKSLMSDLGLNLRIRLHEDSPAANGIAERRGLGKVRHIEVNQLWIQEKVRGKTVELCKVKGIDKAICELAAYLYIVSHQMLIQLSFKNLKSNMSKLLI